METVEDLGIEGGNPTWGLGQALSIGVFTESLDDLPDRLLDSPLVDLAHQNREEMSCPVYSDEIAPGLDSLLALTL
jgi:hypothetical protein